MDISHILNPLNPKQREAVSAENGNILILAGAGSGKTRVLVHRITWYLATEQLGAHRILAVTFTNKAANEMRARVKQLLVNQPVNSMWLGTFHGISHRILRTHWQAAALHEKFQIIDNDDQYRMIRRIIRDQLQLDESQYPPRKIQYFINANKDKGLRADNIAYDDTITEQKVQIYKTYQDSCERSSLVDFAELLLRTVELFRNNQSMREYYQHCFKHLLVDEFQDTNTLQYAWLKLLVNDDNDLFAVGDDDQAIYSWRGAQVKNMQSFNKDFAAAKLLKLQQNYRSTATILTAANQLIDNNQQRLGKELWTDGEQGEAIGLYIAYNEIDEARYVVKQIQQAAAQHQQALNDAAILYRTSAQSRALEEALMHARVPYRVYGGLRFYDRAEIKDAIAYVRLAYFHDDDAAFERIINTPTRGIGNRSVEELRAIARQHQYSLWQAAQHAITDKLLTARALNALTQFIQLIEQMQQTESAVSLKEHIETVIDLSGLIGHFKKETDERASIRIENLEELITAADLFKPSDDELAETDLLAAFLANVSLEAGERQIGDSDDCVHLMTLHAAKGLEFNAIYMVGMEEELLPHKLCTEDIIQLEEERRLCYVGITRAKKKLTLTYTQHRRLHNNDNYPSPSRFINEIPAELLQDVSLKNTVIQQLATAKGTALDDHSLSLGQQVSHPEFGQGVILNIEGYGQQLRLQINFEEAGMKWLIAQYAKLKAV